jgi:hypothetical protein
MTTKRMTEVKPGWEGAGKVAEILGESVIVNGMSWTPVLFDGEEDPEFFKSIGLFLD